jgi:3-deoxy-7-phosphoheptulonate synthase
VAAFEFGSRLENRIARYRDKLCIIMRTYFEKPRSAVGWKGYLNDPDLNGSFQINKGLRNAKKLLNELNDIGVPCGCEFLNTQMPQFLATNISWVSIGARTTESQMHRELASGLAIPIGFKNTTDGNVEHAVKAVLAAREAHWFPSISSQGVSTVFHTTGNRNTHIVLRGGKVSGPNYGPDHVEKACSLLESVGLTPKLMVDCSHGNSGKDWRVQANVVASVIEQRKVNPSRIFGIMLESNLASGNQPFSQASNLVYGQSITDSCMGWEETDDVLARLATD